MGIAVKDGIIPDIHSPVRNIVKDGSFDSEQLARLLGRTCCNKRVNGRELFGISPIGLITIVL